MSKAKWMKLSAEAFNLSRAPECNKAARDNLRKLLKAMAGQFPGFRADVDELLRPKTHPGLAARRVAKRKRWAAIAAENAQEDRS